MRAFQLLQQAGQKREQAERARRLATATTAADVSNALLTYTRQLDEQARPLEERAVELATSETRQRPSSRNEEDKPPPPRPLAGPARRLQRCLYHGVGSPAARGIAANPQQATEACDG